ncbi:hypothetical protein CASFOL_023818 [Castilleja foliolosa]|uniref:Uncharacterized protein n=1 Tax=Castilleja foliolosa TaxID=1961234 RepID=A0ABD3CNM6_9LAMI
MYYSWDSSSFNDLIAAAFSYVVCQSIMLLIKQGSTRHEHKLRKLSHITVGLIVMLCWPMFSCGWRGRVIIAGFVPSLCLVQAFVFGFKSRKHDNHVKFLNRYRNSRGAAQGIVWLYFESVAEPDIFERGVDFGIEKYIGISKIS